MSAGSSGSTSSPASPSTSGSDAAVGGDDRHAERHRFEHRHAEAFVERRLHEQARAFVERAPLAGVDVADVAHVPAQRRPARSARATAARSVGRAPGQHELGHGRRERRVRMPARAGRDQSLVRVEQPADILARLERAEEQHVAVFRRRRPRRPVGRARRADRDPLARDAEQPLDFAGRERPTARGSRRRDARARARAPGSRGGSRRASAPDASRKFRS